MSATLTAIPEITGLPRLTDAAFIAPPRDHSIPTPHTDGPLNLFWRQQIRGRILVQSYDGVPFCVDCLADLPTDLIEQGEHVCEHDRSTPAPAPVVHKTRTYLLGEIYLNWKKARRVQDPFSGWSCTCGAKGYGHDRVDARWRARQHREGESQ